MPSSAHRLSGSDVATVTSQLPILVVGPEQTVRQASTENIPGGQGDELFPACREHVHKVRILCAIKCVLVGTYIGKGKRRLRWNYWVTNTTYVVVGLG